jgi:tetratricopeptide (TPR) repeat protein
MTRAADAHTWKKAMAAFDAWAELPESERAAWLSALSQSDPALHEDVRRLIEADVQAAARDFLSPGATPAAPAMEGLEGQRFGPWLVERLIGTGGMGQVWLARRTDGLYDGLAAIKLMRVASADTAANRRFAREGQLLGRLNHPNIARLLDAGVVASGERYLVLEYVVGERIDRWCDTRRLGIERRIDLLIDVCKAVTHAHENLVVHRDLKPSNIFVADDGQAKLLDFGVAKLLEGDTGDATELTREAGAALTPHYAAPEQLDGRPVTTATDVYSLGLVLYALLAGSRPWDDDGALHGRPAGPPRPLGQLNAADAARIAAERGTSPQALRKALRGDIAVVVAKAIKADPNERYRSVAEFADDLQRTLDRRPIAARPDMLGYRLRRYVQRHTVGVGATLLVALSVAGGVAGTWIQEREAHREAQRAVAVKRFLLDLFDQARSSVQSAGTQAREATVNDMLAAGAERVDKSFAQQPEIRDEIFQVLVELYADTGEPKQIVDLARRRVASARASFGPEDTRTAPAEVQLAGMLLNFGELPEATQLLTHAEGLLDRAGDRTSIERARLLSWQGNLALLSDARPPLAQHPLVRAVELLRARHADNDELLVALMMLPAVTCRYGEPELAMSAAEELYQRTLARYGPDTLYADGANLTRGQLLAMGGRAADALPALQQALEGMRRHVGDKSPNVILIRFDLAEAYLRLGRADESQRELDLGREALQRDHPGDQRLAQVLENAQSHLATIRAGKPLSCKD